jgi:hypothetical protein
MNACFICKQPHWGKRGYKSVLLGARVAPAMPCIHREPELMNMWPVRSNEIKQTVRKVVEIKENQRKAVSA